MQTPSTPRLEIVFLHNYTQSLPATLSGLHLVAEYKQTKKTYTMVIPELMKQRSAWFDLYAAVHIDAYHDKSKWIHICSAPTSKLRWNTQQQAHTYQYSHAVDSPYSGPEGKLICFYLVSKNAHHQVLSTDIVYRGFIFSKVQYAETFIKRKHEEQEYFQNLSQFLHQQRQLVPMEETDALDDLWMHNVARFFPRTERRQPKEHHVPLYGPLAHVWCFL